MKILSLSFFFPNADIIHWKCSETVENPILTPTQSNLTLVGNVNCIAKLAPFRFKRKSLIEVISIIKYSPFLQCFLLNLLRHFFWTYAPKWHFHRNIFSTLRKTCEEYKEKEHTTVKKRLNRYCKPNKDLWNVIVP